MDHPVQSLKRDIIFHDILRGLPFTFHSTWGLFSPREVDEGSRLLIENAEVRPDDDTLEIGCGYGPIGLTLAKCAPRGNAHLVDKDFVAIEYTKKNADLNGIKNDEIYLSNGFSRVPDIQFDLIVSNLPAKAGNEFYTILFHDAKTHLKPDGKLYVVTLSALRAYIKRSFNDIFGNYTKVKQGARYTVSMTQKH